VQLADQLPHNVLSENNEIVGVVVDHCEPNSIGVSAGNAHAEGPSLSRIDIELTDEYTRFRELDDLAGLGRIAIDRVAIGGNQITVWRKKQRQRPA
jgi:hypothetical protein